MKQSNKVPLKEKHAGPHSCMTGDLGHWALQGRTEILQGGDEIKLMSKAGRKSVAQTRKEHSSLCGRRVASVRADPVTRESLTETKARVAAGTRAC